jgi:hypothetical protein
VNQRNLTFAWLGSILLLAVFAGVSWLEILLTPEAGGQDVEITGYMAFPIISALVLLQAASLLATFFTPVVIGRWIAGLLAPVMIGHGVLLVFSIDQGIQNALAGSLSEITGVAGAESQLLLVASSSNTFLWVGYLLAVCFNVAVLATKALSNVGPARKSAATEPGEDSGDLWESQK